MINKIKVLNFTNKTAIIILLCILPFKLIGLDSLSMRNDRFIYGFYFISKSVTVNQPPSLEVMLTELQNTAISQLKDFDINDINNKRTYIQLTNDEITKIRDNVILYIVDCYSTGVNNLSTENIDYLKSLYFYFKYTVNDDLWFLQSPRFFSENTLKSIGFSKLLSENYDAGLETNIYENFNNDENFYYGVYKLEFAITEQLLHNIKDIDLSKLERQDANELKFLEELLESHSFGDILIFMEMP
ncbi:hypothetical protein [Lewinella sp. LCG006]|uniref:hypothetical protein n=1 Tax=Lewinella sp. LCG006 TaxID=3231911 RepID=UPI00345FB358